jgi:hypothetical protein
MEIIDIDIKILNDKYELFMNKILYKSPYKNITTYMGKNIYENKKIIIDVYENNIQLIAKKIINNIIYINHDNVIKIIDIIIEKNITYIIKPYYEKFIYRINKNILENNLNKSDIIRYFKQILNAILYLYSKDIEFENIILDQLYINDKNISISPYFENNIYPQNIIYGSPIYNLYNIKNNNNIEHKIVINICNLFLDIIYKNTNINLEKFDLDLYDIITYLNDDTNLCLQNIINYFENYNPSKMNRSESLNSLFHCEL